MWNKQDSPPEQQPQAPPEAEKDENALKEEIILIPDLIALQKASETPEPEPEKRSILSFLRQRNVIVFLVCAVLIVGVVCFAVFGGAGLMDRAVRLVRYSGDTTEFTFDASSANRYVPFRGGLAVASVSGLRCLNSDAEEIALVQNHMDPPAVLENGTVAMSYGIGGSTITAIHYKDGEILNLTVPGILLDADLSPDSCLCHASVQTGYKTVLTVLNRIGEEIYRWYSSTQFFNQCALSQKAEYMAAIALGQEESSFQTSCVVFATDQEAPIATLPLGSDYVLDLRFVSNRRLCAVGEGALHYFDIDGTNDRQYSYDGGTLLAYDLNGEGFAAIVRNMNEAGSRYRITTVADSGAALAELRVDDEILSISANGNYLAVLTAGSLKVYDSHLRLCLSSDDVGFATEVCVQRDGAALLIDGTTAHRIS